MTGPEIIQGIAERLGKRIEDAARFSEHMTCPSASVIAHVAQLEFAPLAKLVDAVRLAYHEQGECRCGLCSALSDCEAAAKGER